MSNFNFYHFLEEKGYEKETIRQANGETFCYNYQKELTEKTRNCLTFHKDKTISGASPKNGLVFKNITQPKTKEDAEQILLQIEQLPNEE